MKTPDPSKPDFKEESKISGKANIKPKFKFSFEPVKAFFKHKIWLPVWLPIKNLWSKKEGKYLISGLSVVLVFTLLLIGFLGFRLKNTPATQLQEMDSTSLTANVDSLENGAPLTLIGEDGGRTLIQNGQTSLVPPGKYTLQTFVDQMGEGNGNGSGSGNVGSVKGVQEKIEIGNNEKKQVSLSLKPITLDENKAVAKSLNNPTSTKQILSIKPVEQNNGNVENGISSGTSSGTNSNSANSSNTNTLAKITYPSIVLPKPLTQTTSTDSQGTTQGGSQSATQEAIQAAAIVQPTVAKYSLVDSSNVVLPNSSNNTGSNSNTNSSSTNSNTSTSSQSSNNSTQNNSNSGTNNNSVNSNSNNSDSTSNSGTNLNSSTPSQSSSTNSNPSTSNSNSTSSSPSTPSNIPIESSSTLVAQTKEGQVTLAVGCEVSKVMFDDSGKILKYFKACDNGQNGFYQYDLSSKVETQILPTSDSSNQIKVDSSTTQDLMIWTKPEYGQFGIIKDGKSETILSNTYFTAPTFSPDGKYIIVMDNYLTNLSDKQKSDLKLTNSNEDQFGLKVKVVSTEDLLQNKDKANFKEVGTTYYIPRPIDYSFDFIYFTDSTHFMAGDSSKIFSTTGEPQENRLVSDQPGRIFETANTRYRLYQNTLFNSKNEPLVNYVQKVYQLQDKTFYFKVGDFLFRLVDDTPVQAYSKPISTVTIQNNNIELILTDGQVVRF